MPVTLREILPQGAITEEALCALQPQVTAAHNHLVKRSGPGGEYLGWLDLPERVQAQLPGILAMAQSIRALAGILVVVGIGGSYLGARAAIEALAGSFRNCQKDRLEIFYAGHNLSSDYHRELLDYLVIHDFTMIVISKSGTTLEPAIAFRLLRKLLEDKHGKQGARRRIFVITDVREGALRTQIEGEGYSSLAIPADIGGRYSVLSPVGLLPMAAAGIDVKELVAGARQGMEHYSSPFLSDNPSYRYAAYRQLLYQEGKQVELFAVYEPRLRVFSEWWQQLFGESEGKNDKGLLPTGAVFSTDLHSLGQYIQEGPKILFETILHIRKPQQPLEIPFDSEDSDGLNYLAGKDMDDINGCAFAGTLAAHTEAGIPNMVIEIEDLTPWNLGALFYFLEKACGVSAYMLGVNPFNQPGVEAYKKKMFSLLKHSSNT